MTSDPRTAIWVVSLDTDNDRRRLFTDSAVAVDQPWQFFDAHRALSDDLIYDPAVVRTYKGREMTKGELGCYSSHYGLWQQLLSDENHDQYLIMEDDVLVDWNVIGRLCKVPLEQEGNHYIRLYYRTPGRFVVRCWDYVEVFTLIQLYGPSFGTQAYLIDKTAAAKFCAALRIVRRPIDDEMDRYWEHGVANLALFPLPVLERTIPSTIGTGRTRPTGQAPSNTQRAASRRAQRARLLTYAKDASTDLATRILAKFSK